MMAWLRDNIKELENYDGTFHILQSAIVLLNVTFKLNLLKLLEVNHYQVLFKGLCTMSDTGDWLDLESIKESFLKHDRLKSEVVDILKQTQRDSRSRIKPIIEVMFSFPMLHFAQGVWKPFQPITDYVNFFESSRRAALNHFKDVTVKWYVGMYSQQRFILEIYVPYRQ